MVVRAFRFLRRLLDGLLWPYQRDATSFEAVLDLHDEVSVSKRMAAVLPGSVPPRLAVPAAMAVAAVAAGWAIDLALSADFMTETAFPYVFAWDLLLAVGTFLWLDEQGPWLARSMRPTFDASNEEFYRFVGRVAERVYEPTTGALRPAGRYVHWPVAVASLAGIALATRHRTMRNLTGLPIGDYPDAVGLYFAALMVVATLVGVYVFWIIAIGVVFIGWRTTTFTLRLDVVSTKPYFGLREFMRAVFRASLAYLLVLTVTGYLVITEWNGTQLLMFFVMSLAPLVGVTAIQYGIHRAVKRTKLDLLGQLREEYEDDFETWFSTRTPPPSRYVARRNGPLVSAVAGIRALPEWPVNFPYVFRILVGVLLSNLLILARSVSFGTV